MANFEKSNFMLIPLSVFAYVSSRPPSFVLPKPQQRIRDKIVLSVTLRGNAESQQPASIRGKL